MHDTECTAGAELEEWVRNVSDNVNDEMNVQVSALFNSSDQGSINKDETANAQGVPVQSSERVSMENASKPIDKSVDDKINENRYQHVYVWNPQNL